MKKSKKAEKRVWLIVGCCVLVWSMAPYIPMLTNPMRRPPSMATDYVLRLTPIGMDMEEVISIVENHRNWSIRSINYEWGFSHPLHASGSIVGEKSITAWGHPAGSGYWPAPIPVPIYGWFFRTVVSIFWGFDEDGKLIEIYVRQSHGG